MSCGVYRFNRQVRVSCKPTETRCEGSRGVARGREGSLQVAACSPGDMSSGLHIQSAGVLIRQHIKGSVQRCHFYVFRIFLLFLNFNVR